jgi:uncharacterized protein (TIGR02145 family)
VKKQIVSLLFSLGFLCSFFVVQAAGELSPVQPGRGYLADGTDDYVLYDNFDGSMIGNEVTFQYRYEGVTGSKGIWGVTDEAGYRYDIYLSTATRFYVFNKNSSTTQSKYYTFDFPGFTTGETYTLKVQWTADNTIPKFWIDGTEILGSAMDVVAPSVTRSKYYLYTIGAGVGSTSYAGRSRLSDVQVKRSSDGKLLHSWHCDEGSGTMSFDSVREWQGTELATNGTFTSNATGYTTSRCALSWNAGGYATATQNNGTNDNFAILQSGAHVIGKKHRITFRAKSADITHTPAIISAHYSDISLLKNPNLSTQWQNYEYTAVAKSSLLVLYPSITAVADGTTVDLDSISVVELHSPAHGAITNATPATFHVTDTDFRSYQNEVGYSENVPTNVELITNGGFDTDSNWNKGTNWSISNGRAIANGSVYNLTPSVSILLEAGKTYNLELDLKRTSGGLYYRNGGAFASLGIVNEHQNVIFTASSTEAFYFGASTFTGSVDNVSLREITPNGRLVPVALDKNSNATTQDIYGNDATYTGRTRTKAELVGKNVAVFDGVADYVNLGAISANTYNAGTIIGKFKKQGSKQYHSLYYYFDAALHGIQIFIPSTDKFSIYTNVIKTFNYTLPDNEIIDFVLVMSGTTGYLYINGVLVDTQTGITFMDVPLSTQAGIGRWGSANYFKGEIYDLKVYNRAFSASEALQYHNGEAITSSRIHSWTFTEGAGTTVYDTVPKWYGNDLLYPLNFTTGWVAGGGGVINDNDSYSITTSNTGISRNILTVGKKYKYSISGTKDVTVTRVGLRAWGSFNYYSTDFTANTFSETGIFTAVTGASLGLITYGTGQVNINNLTLQEIYEPNNGTVTNANLNTFWATNMSAEDQNLVNGYTSGLVNVTAGTADKENTQAYGTWEFDLYKGGDTTVPFITFINDENALINYSGTYGFVFQNDETIRFAKDGALVWSTATSYISNNTWYRIKIERNQTLNQYHTGAVGSFAVYIKGGGFGDEYVLVSTAGGSGTNPVTDNTYTTSAYSVVDLDAGDQVAGFMANNKIVDFHSFTNGTGAYDKLSLPAQSGETGLDIRGNRLTYTSQDLRSFAMAYKNVAVFDGTDDVVTVPATSSFDTSDAFSSFVWIKKTPGNGGTIWRSDAHTGMDFWNGATTFRGMVLSSTCSGWSNQFVGYPDDGKWHQVGMTYDHVNMKLYIDGVLKTTIPFVCDLGLNSPINIGTYSASHFGGSIYDLRIYNRALSAADVQKLYQGQPISTNGLVAHYPLSEAAGVTAYNSAPTWDGANLVTNGQFLGDGDWTKGAGWTISTGKANVNTTSTSGLTQTVFEIGKKYKLQFEISNYVAGRIQPQASGQVISTVATPNGSYEFTFIATGGTTLYLYAVGTTNLSIDNVSVQEVHEPAHGTLTNTTASIFWQIDNSVPVSQSYINGFSQGLVNTTGGSVYTPSTVAYGEWEFDVYKGADGNSFAANLISSEISDYLGSIGDRYSFVFHTDERMYLVRKANGSSTPTVIFSSSLTYASNNTWYRIKITRSSAGVFTAYVKGGSFGDDYVLVSTTGGSGTNPVTDTTYTTSNYFVADLDAGDQIANVQIDGHRASVHEFKLGTGAAYSKLFIPAQTGRGMDVLGSVTQIIGTKTATIFTATDLARIAAQKLARAGINYWDTTTKKFFTGRADGSLADFVVNTARMKTTSELVTINTNKTANSGYNYWDTTLKKFLRGIADGSVQSFQSWFWSGKCPDTVSDGAGKIYDTVKIGSQCWMKQYLNFGTKVNDPGAAAIAAACAGKTGTDQVIGGIQCRCITETYASCQQGGVTKKYCYANDEANCTTNGALYEWHEAMNLPSNCAYTDCSAQINTPHQGICPRGWHIPTDAEWKTLEGSQGMTVAQQDVNGLRGTDEGDKLKAADKCTGGLNCNSSEFSAVLAGYRYPAGGFYYSGSFVIVWSASKYNSSYVWSRALYSGYSTVRRDSAIKGGGVSLRCIQD